MRGLLALLGLLVCAGTFYSSGAATAQDETGQGAKLFAKQCAVCHGDEGRGDGPAAYLLNPKPRDLARGSFRLTTTRNGIPSEDDLFRVITNGMPGSTMPPWDRLSEDSRRLLARTIMQMRRTAARSLYEADDDLEPEEVEQYVKEDSTPGPPISFAGEMKPTLDVTARGRITYTRACAPCHGQDGRGETTKKLVDSKGFPAPARDFTKGIFKGGSEPRQLWARLRAGMKGSAMPSYDEANLSTEDGWAVVHYIRTLFPPGAQARQQQNMKHLKVRKVSRIPEKEADWPKATPAAYVALMPLWWRDKRVEGLLFQAVHDGNELVMRLTWEDPTENNGIIRHQDFHDGAAVQLSWDEDPPFFGMGDASSSVLIWSWKASWQVDRKGFRDLESFYPNFHLDTYFPRQKNLKAGERSKRDAVSAPHHDPGFLSGWGAGNAVSNPHRPSAVEVARAKGLGTYTTQEKEAQKVQGSAVWDRGVWTLVIRSDLAAARLSGLFIGFGVWDGAQGDRDGQKSVSIWHRLDME